MSKNWRSLKKTLVDGDAFRRARLAVEKRNENVKRGEYGHGSQDWLAEQADVSSRTINALEKGRATLRTVDAVSEVLSIKGRQYIQGYGEEFTTIRAPGVIDFRSSINGRMPENKTAYLDAPFMVTVDPVVITIDDDFIESASLQNMELTLSVDDMAIDFSWLYSVRLTSRSSTWLGDEEDVGEIEIITHEPYQQSYMFKQKYYNRVSWRQFIDHIGETVAKQVSIKLRLKFEHFIKEDSIIVSIEEIRFLFSTGYPKNHPYWVQPNALMV